MYATSVHLLALAVLSFLVVLEALDLQAFVARARRAQDPVRVAKAARSLVDGALRIRTGNDGIYGLVSRPVTKPAEAVGAWLKSLEIDMAGGDFQRHNEVREALVAAAEEVDAAAQNVPKADRLRGALYADALAVVGGEGTWMPSLPWIIATGLAGILAGVLITMFANAKRRR